MGDPKAPHSSSLGGAGRTDAPMAKRARLRYLNNNDDDDDEQRRRPTLKSSNGKNCLVPAEGNLVLPIDLLTSSLLYLDVGDIPSALAVCKDWRKALQSAEDQFLLGLVRKHCPSVEEITNLLELSPKKELGGSGGSIGGVTTSGIPPPSKNWRRQFQRHLLLGKSDGSAAAEKPPPKPLSAYLFKVDLVLYRKKEGVAGKGEEVGVVSRVFSDAKFNSSNKRIEFEFERMNEDMKKQNFSTFDIRITVYEKETGRQATVHQSSLTDRWDPNYWNFGFTKITSAYKMDGIVTPDDNIETEVEVMKTGCANQCGHTFDWDFFDKPSCRYCHCKCNEPWSCFWDMRIDLHIASFFDWDVVTMSLSQQLRLFEEHIEFK